MKKIFAVLLVSLVCAMPLQTRAEITTADALADENYPYYLAAGAVAGVLVFNFLTGGIEALPFVTSSSSMWEGPVAANRVFTAISLAVGALAVDWGYKNLDLKKSHTTVTVAH